jgi:phage shock protein A
MTKKDINKLIEENKNFKKLVKYTIEDISDLFWEYDRLSRMYAMQYEQERNFQIYGGGNNALSK